MIDSIFIFESTRARQRNAPMLAEREQYLSYMLREGVSKQRVRSIAAMLLSVVRLLNMHHPRVVDIVDLQRAGQRWLTDTGSHKTRRAGTTSVSSFLYTARNWLQFHNLAPTRAVPTEPIELLVKDFTQYLAVSRGLTISTIRTCGSRVRQFLSWAAPRRAHLSMICLQEVDAFLSLKRAEGCLPRTIASYCAAFRTYFRYTESLGWNGARLARGLHSPRIARFDAPRGPDWGDVRRLINSDFGVTAAGLRAAAIVSLCSLYALRSTEVVNLLLSDADWVNETLTVRRSKRGTVQQFPLQFEVGEFLLRYLQQARPQCSCPHLFVTLRPPYRPVQSSTLWSIVGPRMKTLGVKSEHFGAHSLRHACATQLLREGSSLREIADFLGHHDMKSVSIYAKSDMRSLRQVATFSLVGVK